MIGFPEQAFVFYEGLEADNSKAYWNDHKQVYDDCVKAPMLALLDALEPDFGAFKLFRPYRDVRFSKDKTPYKTAQGAVSREQSCGLLYVQISADGLMVAGGGYQLQTDQSRRLRAAIAEDRSGTALATILRRLEKAGFEVHGDRLKRIPKECGDGEHPRADLLTLKTLTGMKRFEPADWMHTDEVRTRVVASWKALTPLNDWLAQHVGGPQSAVQREASG